MQTKTKSKLKVSLESSCAILSNLLKYLCDKSTINLPTQAALVNQLLSRWSYYKSVEGSGRFIRCGNDSQIELSLERHVSVMDENISDHINC